MSKRKSERQLTRDDVDRGDTSEAKVRDCAALAGFPIVLYGTFCSRSSARCKQEQSWEEGGRVASKEKLAQRKFVTAKRKKAGVPQVCRCSCYAREKASPAPALLTAPHYPAAEEGAEAQRIPSV